MGINEIFYSVAIFFFLVLIGYFVSEYMADLASQVKVVLSFLLAVILLFVGDFMRGKNI